MKQKSHSHFLYTADAEYRGGIAVIAPYVLNLVIITPPRAVFSICKIFMSYATKNETLIVTSKKLCCCRTKAVKEKNN